MPAFLEASLKRQYGEESDVPYKIMNAKGYMHGNKTTAKGHAAQRKHDTHIQREALQERRAKKG